MTDTLDAARVARCIHRYIAAWNAQDFEAMAAHFTEPCVFVVAGGTTVMSRRAELAAFLRVNFEALNARGFGHTEIGRITSRRLGPTLALAEVDDIRRYRRDGSHLETLEVLYTLRLESSAPDGLLIVSALWCEPGWRDRVL